MKPRRFPPPPRVRPKATPERRLEARARREVYRQLGNIVVEAHKYSGLAIDTLVAIAKDGQTDSSRQSAAVELLNRGYGRPAQSVDSHLTTEAITRRLSDMTDADLATLEARMIAAAPIDEEDRVKGLSIPVSWCAPSGGLWYAQTVARLRERLKPTLTRRLGRARAQFVLGDFFRRLINWFT